MVTDTLLDEIRRDIAARDRTAIQALGFRVGPALWAEVVPHLTHAEIAVLFQWLPDDQIADMLGHLDPAAAAEILRTLTRHEAADLLEAMQPDEATDVITELRPSEAEQILIQMEPAEAAELRELLSYPPDTAGGHMTPAFVAVEPNVRADEAISALRRVAEAAETVYYVYVMDADEHLLGVLPLHRLVLTRPDTPVGDIMATEIIRVRADADQEVAAQLLMDHDLLALPVVDAENHLLGIVTQDDIADVIEAEATEDIERLGGSQPLEIPYRRAGVWLLTRRRIVWLLLLFAAEAYTGTVLRHYQDETERVIALSFFVPLLIGTGGNVGSQTVTTLVRAMAVEDLRLRDIGWVLSKEVAVAVVMGAVMSIVAFGRAQILRVGIDVGIVVALTIAAICVWAAMVAAVLPMTLRKLRIDPAVVSAPFISTLVDGTGLIIYFTIAKLVLGL